VIDMRIKSMFFDRPKVQRAVDRSKRRSLSRAGAFIRQRARTSIRKRKRQSRPGQPPSSHTGLLRRFILFGYDRRSDSVVVGPVGFRRSRSPHVLEFGGRTTVESRRRGGRRQKRTVRIAARPYMRPALEKERSQLPAVWRNSVRGG
jgi:phage gpG-like protein